MVSNRIVSEAAENDEPQQSANLIVSNTIVGQPAVNTQLQQQPSLQIDQNPENMTNDTNLQQPHQNVNVLHPNQNYHNMDGQINSSNQQQQNQNADMQSQSHNMEINSQQYQQIYPQQQVMVIKHNNQDYLEKVRLQQQQQNQQFWYYHNILHNKPIKDEDGNEKVVKLSRSERRQANKQYYRLYNERQKRYRKGGQTHFFYCQNSETTCSDCCVIVIMPVHIQDSFSNQGCCLNLFKLISYIAFLPFRLLYFFFTWQYDNCGKQCCSSIQECVPSCKGCIAGCQNIVCCQVCNISSMIDGIGDGCSDIEPCCMNYCTIFGVCNECGCDVNNLCRDMIGWIIDNCTCLGTFVAACMGQVCRFLGNACTCIYESGKDLLDNL